MKTTVEKIEQMPRDNTCGICGTNQLPEQPWYFLIEDENGVRRLKPRCHLHENTMPETSSIVADSK